MVTKMMKMDSGYVGEIGGQDQDEVEDGDQRGQDQVLVDGQLTLWIP